MPTPTINNVDNPRGLGFGCAFDDRLFRMVAGPGRELTIRTAPIEAPRVNTAASPEEMAAEFGLVFARSQFDGGEGLYRAHVPGAEPNRFWDSKNIDVSPPASGEFPELRLHRRTELLDASTEASPYMAYNRVEDALYVVKGTGLRRSANPLASTPTFADDDPHDGETATDVEDVAALGDETYAALGANGIHRKSSGTWAHWNDLAATRIWSVKGRIVASDGESLYEVLTSGAAPSALVTLAPGESWSDVVDGGSHVLAGASDGYVYAFGTDTGALALDSQSRFTGECIHALGQSQGQVAVGTCSMTAIRGRLYVASVAANGQLDDIRLVKEWSNARPKSAAGTRSTLLLAVKDTSDTDLWAYDLRTGGVSRDLTVAGVSADGFTILTVGGTKFVSVSGSGVWRESDLYADSGYLIGPLGDFFSSSAKSWVGAALETGTLQNGAVVELYYTTNPNALADPDSVSWIRVARRDTGSGDPGPIPLTSVVARSLAGMVKLTPETDLSDTPVVRSFLFSAYSSSGNEDSIIDIPINVSDQVERRGVGRRRVRGLGATTYTSLRTFEGRPVLLTLYGLGLTVRGLVEEVATPIPALTKRGSTTLVAMVRVRGKVVASAASTSGAGTFGTMSAFATPPPFGETE